MGELSLVTAPAVEPVTLLEAKSHVREETADNDALILTLIKAAREHVETFTRRALITQTWDLKLDAFPCGYLGRLTLPMAPVSAVSSISYLDTSGATQTWSSAYYRAVLFAGPKAPRSYIEPAYGYSYPSTLDVSAAATVRFVCGYGTDPSTVPAGVKAAIKLLVGHWFENRAAVNVGNLVTDLPRGVDALLWPYRSF